jgi:hypothetical protein
MRALIVFPPRTYLLEKLAPSRRPSVIGGNDIENLNRL